MNTPASQQIISRFYEAVDYLVSNKVMNSMLQFTKRYDIRYSTFFNAKRDHASQLFQPSWMTYLVSDYGVSAKWLLTGEGKMIARKVPVKAPIKSV